MTTTDTAQHNPLQGRMLQEPGSTFTRQAIRRITILTLHPGQQPGEVQVDLRGDGQVVTVSRPVEDIQRLTEDLLSEGRLWSQADADYEAGHDEDDGETPTEPKPLSEGRLSELLAAVPEITSSNPEQKGVEVNVFPTDLSDTHECYEAYLETPAGTRAVQASKRADLITQLRRIIPLLARE